MFINNSSVEIEIINLKQLIIHLSNNSNTISLDTKKNRDWVIFNTYFNNIFPDFYSNTLKHYPDISTNDLYIMALLKLHMSNKQISQVLNISNEGIKKARYRLRKKMNLKTSQSLEEVVLSI